MTEKSTNSIPWIEKYRPKKLEDMTQAQNLIDLFQNTIKTGDMTHYLFYGLPGTGKTSAILAIGREIFKEFFASRVIEFNASDDRGINAVREKITGEAKKYVTNAVSVDGTRIPPYKIIILDEADSMTDEAQDALRVIIEQYSTVTRFCFICNYISKITDAIKSRCSAVYFKKINNECMVSKLSQISKEESITLPNKIISTIITVSNGDMRKAIMLLQNVKYLHDFKANLRKPVLSMTLAELKYINTVDMHSNYDTAITELDIYDIAASITIDRAHGIINNILLRTKIIEIVAISKEIIAMGYPIDNVLIQLNRAVLETTKLNDQEKARIINYSGAIFLKMKECANEYIQLLDYLSCVNGVAHGNTAYQCDN